jgi:hypothetical protein
MVIGSSTERKHSKTKRITQTPCHKDFKLYHYQIRYVGCSRNVPERTRAHINGFTSTWPVGKWILQLRRLKLKPQVFLLQLVVQEEQRRTVEAQWIRNCLERGANLLNVLHSGRRFNSLNKTETWAKKSRKEAK